MTDVEDVRIGVDPLGAGVSSREDPEGSRLTRHSSFALRRVMNAPRDTLVRVERELTSTVDLPLVSGPEATLHKLGTSVVRGLSRTVAEERLKQYGANELDRSRSPNVLELILLQVRGEYGGSQRRESH
jgi:Cation transporter/ATPase, N-terminus